MTGPVREMQWIDACRWPRARVGNALAALLSRSGVANQAEDLPNPSASLSDEGLASWVEEAAKRLGADAEPVETTLSALTDDLRRVFPALLRLHDDAYLAILECRGRSMRLLTPEGSIRRVKAESVSGAIRERFHGSRRAAVDRLLEGANVSSKKGQRAASCILLEQVGSRRPAHFWKLRMPVSAPAKRWFRETGALGIGAALAASHTAYYLLWLLSWSLIGKSALAGHMDRGWLIAWALLLLTVIPFRSFGTWLQGRLVVNVGGMLKQRLLWGAMHLDAQTVRSGGIGQFLGQALEAETLETLALNGGIAGLLALIELVIACVVLGRLAPFLIAWCGVTLLLALRFWKRYQKWTAIRLDLTQDLVEAMVGHRTRLVQMRSERFHDTEDQALDHYLEISKDLDKSGTLLIAAVPRAWLVIAIAAMAPGFVSAGQGSSLVVAVGGMLLAYSALRRLTGSLADIAAAYVAWQKTEPLFRAAERKHVEGALLPGLISSPRGVVLQAERIGYRQPATGRKILQECSVSLQSGDRILIEGPSGGGKTTLAAVLSGRWLPDSGLLLAGGLDMQTVGFSQWRRTIASAPQFHENHVLTETLAFNLLMGKAWPPTPMDMEMAEEICRELGLGGLLDRMPSGMQQMVGESGWQLSHGERSRIFIARALLQGAETVILDESFAALDPGNLEAALDCALRRAPTLVVIAHP